jgi:hypothetical protein
VQTNNEQKKVIRTFWISLPMSMKLAPTKHRSMECRGLLSRRKPGLFKIQSHPPPGCAAAIPTALAPSDAAITLLVKMHIEKKKSMELP